jgi:hypothetical protein
MRTGNWSRAAGRFGRLVLLTASLTACTKWQVQTLSPQQVLATRHPDKIRVTRADSTQVVLTKPQIVGDTLYGMAAGQRGVALADVSRVSIRRGDPLATGSVIGGTAAVLTGVGLIIWASIVSASD